MMNNKSTFQLFSVLFFITALGETLELTGISPNNNIVNIGLSVLRLAGIILIIQNGSILKSKPFIQIIYFLICTTIIGSMFKIMHWPYGNLLFTAGLSGIILTYAIHFINKKVKKLLDVLKLLW